MGVSSRFLHLATAIGKALEGAEFLCVSSQYVRFTMFDTMTITKVGGGLCGALLVFLLLNWAAETIYSTEVDSHGEHAEAAYVIEVEDTDDGDDSHDGDDGDDDMVDFASLVATADAEKGKKVFSKCKACHKLEEGKKGVGPTLYEILDRDIANMEGFKYSSALTALEGDWTADALNAFIENPKGYAKGTKMSFKGLKKESDRANLIAYLATVGD